MTCIVAISTVVPVIGIIKLPGRNRPYTVASRYFVVCIIKMLVPIAAFNTNPFGTIAACKACNIGTANKAEFAIVADTLTFGAILLTIRANNSTFRARAAVLTDQNTLGAQIAAFAECVGTFTAPFPTALTKDRLIAALLTAGAMVAICNGAIQTKLVCCTNIGASRANTAFDAVFTAIVTARTLCTVHS